MHHYSVIVAKTEDAKRAVASRLERFVHGRLVFEPDEVIFHRLADRTFVFAVSAEQRSLGIATLAHLTDQEVCLVGGLPTFERFPECRPSSAMRPAAWASELLRTHDPSDLRAALGGSYSIVNAKAGEITAFASFSGYDSLFYLDNDLYTVVGSRPSLPAAFQSTGPYSAIDRRALSWIFATTMIIGDATPWQEVSRLRTERVLTVGADGVSVRPVTLPSHAPPDERSISEFYDAAVQGMVSRLDWHLRSGGRFKAHLTGGKDSRMNLALLLTAGAVDRLDAIVTIGSEQNGDVIVARQIADCLGLRSHVVHEGGKGAVKTVELARHERHFRFSPWKYDMYLTPYDGRVAAEDHHAADTTLMGGGGEILRQKGIAPNAQTDGIDQIVERFTNWYGRCDPFEWVESEIAEWQRAVIKDEVTAMVDEDVVNLQQRFYIEHRMANWGSAHFRSASSGGLATLLDFDMTRAMHRRPDMADDLPYEIMTRCAPELRAFAFSNDEWLGHTRERAERDGTFRPRVSAEVAANFPWQFALYRDHRNDLLQECLRSISLWDGIIRPDRVHRQLTQPVEPFGSSRIKVLFGLVAASNYVLGTLAPARDFAMTSAPLRLRGSEATLALPWFAHREPQIERDTRQEIMLSLPRH